MFVHRLLQWKREVYTNRKQLWTITSIYEQFECRVDTSKGILCLFDRDEWLCTTFYKSMINIRELIVTNSGQYGGSVIA